MFLKDTVISPSHIASLPPHDPFSVQSLIKLPPLKIDPALQMYIAWVPIGYSGLADFV